MDASFYASSIERGRFAPGTRGTVQTLAKMRRLVHEGTTQDNVREAALRVIRRAGAKDDRSALLALFRFVADGVKFKRDPVGVEQLQSPRVTLLAGTGDCDDKTTLLIGLAEAAGLPYDWRMRVIATRPRWPHIFNHVFPVAQLHGVRFPLDATYAGTPPGWTYPRVFRSAEVPV